MNEQQTPPRIQPRLRSAPKIRQFFWCDFPEDAHLPEFWKTRPVIVLSKNHTLHGVVTVVPCTTLNQDGNRYAVKLATQFHDKHDSWAICDKPSTVAVSRLSAHRNPNLRVSQEEFEAILSCVALWLPLVPIQKT